MTKPKNYVWCIAYIDFDLVGKIPSDLRKSNQYKGVKAIIPTVRVLKKQVKNKDHFKEVPLLMNYGFFRIPINWAINIDLLNKIKTDISCITGWVKDRTKGAKPDKKKKKKKEEPKPRRGIDERDVPIATTSKKVINHCCKTAEAISIFSSDDINRIKEGDIIYLMGYPFENMRAKIKEINLKTKKVMIYLADEWDEEGERYNELPIEVHFDNVFYSIYQGSHDENYNQEALLEDFHVNRRKKEQDDEVQ